MQVTDKHLVAVVWRDAHARIIDDYSVEEIEKDFHKPAIYTTFGLLVYENDVGVTLACDLADDGRFRGLNFIPKGMIVEQVDLGIPKKKTSKKKKIVLIEEKPAEPL